MIINIDLHSMLIAVILHVQHCYINFVIQYKWLCIHFSGRSEKELDSLNQDLRDMFNIQAGNGKAPAIPSAESVEGNR